MPDSQNLSEDSFEEFFSKLEQYILDNYPNPNRVGCSSPEELKELIHHPERFDLQDERYLHLFRCAECTRDVKALREELDKELAAGKATEQSASSRSSRDPEASPQRKSGVSYRTLAATGLASLCLGALLIWVSMVRHSQKPVPPSETTQVLDIGVLSPTRGTDAPAKVVMLRQASIFLIELPVLSSAGKYHVAVVDSDSKERVSADGTTRAAESWQLELPVTLNLTSVPPGKYRLAIRNQADGVVSYYEVTLQ